MRTQQIVLYDKEDLEHLDNMSNQEIVTVLKEIQSRWIPHTYVINVPQIRSYDEEQYNQTRLYKGLHNAINLIEDINNIDVS